MKKVSGSLWTDFIFLSDYILLPIYLIILYIIINRIRDRYYPIKHPWRPYFIAGFTVKILGAIFISLVYQYYYSGGDTSAYFYHANIINSAANESITKWFNLLGAIPERYDGNYIEYTSKMLWYGHTSTYFVSRLTAIINVFTFNTFLPSSVIIATISFSGNWALFRTFASQYPKYIRSIAIATLFIPSTFVWGSGIFKDTYCLFGLGWMTYSIFQLLIRRNLSFKNLFILAFSFYLVTAIKIYIIIAFVPALMLWILFVYSGRIRNAFIKWLTTISVITATISGFFFSTVIFAKELGDYSLENISETSASTRNYIYTISTRKDASAYDLGAIDPTPSGMAKKIPAAVNVTLFRPYLWEARKPIIFLNAIEASLFFFFTLKVLISVGPLKAWRSVAKNPNIQFFLIFTLIFAFAVGISSYNFGALSRYRIPCLPFYACALVLIYYDNKPESNRFFSLNFR